MQKLSQNLEQLLAHAKGTRKQGTIMTALTNTEMEEEQLWMSIGRDLEVAGISREMVSANRDVIRDKIQDLFRSASIDGDTSEVGSIWESASMVRAERRVSYSPATSGATTAYDASPREQHTLDRDYGGLQTYSEPQRSKVDLDRSKQPRQLPWEKLEHERRPFTNDDAAYRPFVIEIRMVTPELTDSTHFQNGFSFKKNHILEDSWVFVRLSQHTRQGLHSLSTPNPYNPVQDYGHHSAAKWSEFALSQALRDWKHLLHQPDQPVYVCMSNCHETALETLAKQSSIYPRVLSFEVDTNTISHWKLERKGLRRPVLGYYKKPMDKLPNTGIVQFAKRLFLQNQAKALGLEGARGRGQMLLMLFTQKSIDLHTSLAHTWIREQELSGKLSDPDLSQQDELHRPDRPVHQFSDPGPAKIQPDYRQQLHHLPDIQIPVNKAPPTIQSAPVGSYLAKASAVCGFEASSSHDLSFVTDDEILITEYLGPEIWHGLNQRTQLSGSFPNTLVKVFSYRVMPGRKQIPHEIGSSAMSFGSPPVNNTFLSPHQMSPGLSIPSRTERSASAGALPKPTREKIYELDSTELRFPVTELPGNSRLSTMPESGIAHISQQLNRAKTSVSDRGPGRAAATQSGAEANVDDSYLAPLGPSTIGRSKSERVWTSNTKPSTVSHAPPTSHIMPPYRPIVSPAPSHVVSPYMSPVPAPIPTSRVSTPLNLAASANNSEENLKFERLAERFAARQRDNSDVPSLKDVTPPASPQVNPQVMALVSALAAARASQPPQSSTDESGSSSTTLAPSHSTSGSGWDSTSTLDGLDPQLVAQIAALLQKHQHSAGNKVPDSERASALIERASNPSVTSTEADDEAEILLAEELIIHEEAPRPPIMLAEMSFESNSLLKDGSSLIPKELEQQIFNLSVKAGENRD